MKHFGEIPLWIFSLVGSLTAFISGHTDQAVKILVAMMVLDAISGLMKGAKHKRLKSAIMHMGLLKKAGTLLAIVFAIMLDYLANDGMPVFKTLMVYLAIGNEGLSITENLKALGVYVPAQISDRLAQFNEEGRQLQKEKDDAQG